jgi:predicted dehydrogenase
VTTEVDTMGIGIIGVGGVGLWAHLPAYRRLGLPVVAVHDLDVELARRTAEEYRVPSVARSARELVYDDRVRVVDLATPPSTHVELMALAAAADKPVLVQKPLVTDPAQLADVTRLRAAGARVRLNMTGRYVSAWVKVAELLREGAIGRPFLCTIRNRDWWDRGPDRWDHDVTGYIVHEMLTHHLDLCLPWFGAPARVAARTGSHPRQRMQQANWAAVMLDYDAGPLVQILEDWAMGQFAFAQGHPSRRS